MVPLKLVNTEHMLTEAEARSLGYRPLTSGYSQGEHWMMERVIADMARAGSDWCLVRVAMLPEVWRKGMRGGDQWDREQAGRLSGILQ